MGDIILDPTKVFEVMPSDIPLWQNIVAVYDGSSELERRRGGRWYTNAWRFSRMLAETHWHNGKAVRNVGAGTQRKTMQAAGIVALLAQNTSWERNQELATELFASKGELAGGTFSSVIDKCGRVFRGEDPFAVVGGPKISAFLACIAAQGECDDVTVDRHAAHIAYGRIMGDRERGQALRVTKSRNGYDTVARAYQMAAEYINKRDSEHWSPAKIQAITWVAWRHVLLGEDRGFITAEQQAVAS